MPGALAGLRGVALALAAVPLPPFAVALLFQ